jgi:hypothetical protein
LLEVYAAIPIRVAEVGLKQAVELSAKLNVYAYDGYILACAINERAPLLTLDGGLSADPIRRHTSRTRFNKVRSPLDLANVIPLVLADLVRRPDRRLPSPLLLSHRHFDGLGPTSTSRRLQSEQPVGAHVEENLLQKKSGE